MLSALSEYISIKSIAGDKEENDKAIIFLKNMLIKIGFSVSIEGESKYEQPTVIAKYNSTNSNKKVVLYGHYDVEKIHQKEKWVSSDPFILEEKNNRLYGRGIADNKGIFLARIFAIKEMVEKNETVPSILWLIQGEEEVGGLAPFEVFPKHTKDFGARLYIEETGYHNKSQQLIFSLPKEPKANFLENLNETVFQGNAKIEYRTLNKFFVAGKCPFMESIPNDGYYLGFGPNDELSNIHQENESLDKALLIMHINQFQKFLTWTTEADI